MFLVVKFVLLQIFQEFYFVAVASVVTVVVVLDDAFVVVGVTVGVVAVVDPDLPVVFCFRLV